MKLKVKKIRFTGSRKCSMDSRKFLEIGITELTAT